MLVWFALTRYDLGWVGWDDEEGWVAEGTRPLLSRRQGLYGEGKNENGSQPLRVMSKWQCALFTIIY